MHKELASRKRRSFFMARHYKRRRIGHLRLGGMYPLSAGVAAMRSRARVSSHPIHPMLITFPFGLWVTSFIFDVIGRASGNQDLFAAGFYAVIAGCVGAALAAVPGVIDLFATVPPNSSARQRGYIHGG